MEAQQRLGATVWTISGGEEHGDLVQTFQKLPAKLRYGSPSFLQCSVGPSSDKALTFMKDHFLMDEKVAPIHNQPLLVKEDVKYTRIAVDQARKPCGTACTVLFLGTGRAPSTQDSSVGGELRGLLEQPPAQAGDPSHYGQVSS